MHKLKLAKIKNKNRQLLIAGIIIGFISTISLAKIISLELETSKKKKT
jgi:preprotein translocase subunit SecF